MLNIKQRKERDFNDLDLDSKDEAFEFLKSQLHFKQLSIKNAPEIGEVRINEYLDDKSIMVVTNPEFLPDKKITLYALLDKYIEIELLVHEIRGPGYFRCKIETIKRAAVVRKEIRFKVSSEKVVATNFKISKHTIEISNYSIPTSITVLLEQFQSQNSNLSDIVKVDTFKDDDLILRHIKKTGETAYIADISKNDSYDAMTFDFVDLKKLLGADLNGFIKKNVERGYKSLLISPLIYLTNVESSIPFAYIKLISKKENFSIEKVLEIKDLIFKLIDRIRDANTILVQVHQKIIDISRSGSKLMITDENLKKYMFRAKGFVFDIVFKLQAPITIYGDIKSTYTDDDGNMIVGVDFAGNSSRLDEMKRFYSMLDPMIKDYKNNLLKQMKSKKTQNQK